MDQQKFGWREATRTTDGRSMQYMGWHMALLFLPPPLVEMNLAYSSQTRQGFGHSSCFLYAGSHPN